MKSSNSTVNPQTPKSKYANTKKSFYVSKNNNNATKSSNPKQESASNYTQQVPQNEFQKFDSQRFDTTYNKDVNSNQVQQSFKRLVLKTNFNNSSYFQKILFERSKTEGSIYDEFCKRFSAIKPKGLSNLLKGNNLEGKKNSEMNSPSQETNNNLDTILNRQQSNSQFTFKKDKETRLVQINEIYTPSNKQRVQAKSQGLTRSPKLHQNYLISTTSSIQPQESKILEKRVDTKTIQQQDFSEQFQQLLRRTQQILEQQQIRELQHQEKELKMQNEIDRLNKIIKKQEQLLTSKVSFK